MEFESILPIHEISPNSTLKGYSSCQSMGNIMLLKLQSITMSIITYQYSGSRWQGEYLCVGIW